MHVALIPRVPCWLTDRNFLDAAAKAGREAAGNLNSVKAWAPYLADKMEENEVEVRWRGQKVQAYLNQILFVAHQPTKVGLRTSRELTTLGVTLDHLLAGRLPQATDTLMQRLKALEASLQEGGWQVAKHLEIIPPSAASLMREEEGELATKNELRSLKLKDAVSKMQKASK